MIVFVHGVPESGALWNNLRNLVDEPSTALSLPGFGNPRPDGFPATKDAYAEWLVNELRTIDEPVDLVGHDWGALISCRVVTTEGDLVRSWVTDCGNVVHPDYVWHQFAQVWQTPGEGEAFFEQQAGASPEESAVVFEAMGVPHDDAVALAASSDDTMAGCILDLYRSAVPNPHADWGAAMGPTKAPGMILHPTDDPFSDDELSRQVAGQLGARHTCLDGLGHWWMLQDPKSVADVLQDFWASVR